MTFFEVLLIGIGLSMDAAAVSMTDGMVYRQMGRREFVLIALFFGFFQALMPLLGYFVGGLFSDFICKYSGIVIFLILGIIGSKMIKEALSHTDDEHVLEKRLTYSVLFVQAIATSIDAFAVGVGFAASGMTDILSPVTVIGITTFIISIASVIIGRRFGDMLGSKAEFLGGIILILIGIKAMISFFK